MTLTSSLTFVSSALSEIGQTAVELVLPTKVSRRLLPQREHYAPHASTLGFEGYYTRIMHDSDEHTIAVIFCSVPNAPVGTRKHYVHLSILPLKPGASLDPIECHFFPEDIHTSTPSPGNLPFSLDATDIGTYTCDELEQRYTLSVPHPTLPNSTLLVSISLTGRTPLDPTDPLRTPHGAVARLEHLLPLHWDFLSKRSKAVYTIRVRDDISGSERVLLEGTGRGHIEKNWGASFPKGWTWSQAFTQSSSSTSTYDLARSNNACLVLAGGKIFGQKAYLIHYATSALNWTFSPPFTIYLGLSIPSLSSIQSYFIRPKLQAKKDDDERAPTSHERRLEWGPFIREQYDNNQGTLGLDVSTLTQRLIVNVESTEPMSTWLALYCPLPNGHATAAYETFTATAHIAAYSRSILAALNPFNLLPGTSGGWTKVDERKIENAALEFGGDYWQVGLAARKNQPRVETKAGLTD